MIYLIAMDGRVVLELGYFDTKYDAWDRVFDEVGLQPEYSVIEMAPSKEVLPG